MKTKENNYCVWSLKPSIDYPEANVFKYNQTLKSGTELAKQMNDEYHQGEEVYFCTDQQIGIHDESLGPHKHDVVSKFANS